MILLILYLAADGLVEVEIPLADDAFAAAEIAAAAAEDEEVLDGEGVADHF